jgi:hypothetical protein
VGGIGCVVSEQAECMLAHIARASDVERRQLVTILTAFRNVVA